MNLKYYLRGLGMGIIVTALIMGISLGGKQEALSDNEIKERAKALGMVEESTRLADAVQEEAEATAVPTAAPTEAPTQEPDQQEEPTQEPTAEPTEKPTPEPTAMPTSTPEKAETQKTPAKAPQTEKEGTVTIRVESGDGSYTVCKKLEEAGLVISATDFDTYLCQEGYDKRIRTGSFEIEKGADPQQIARIISGME